MIRTTFTFAAALLLLLAVAGAVLWARSYFAADRVHGVLRGRQSLLVASKQGEVVMLVFRWHGAANGWRWAVRSYDVEDMMSFPLGDVKQYAAALGFGAIHRPLYQVMRPEMTMPDGSKVIMMGASTATLNGSGVIVPYWFIVLTLGTIGLAGVRGPIRRRRRRRRGQCLACGYDLRGNTSGRCPECGGELAGGGSV